MQDEPGQNAGSIFPSPPGGIRGFSHPADDPDIAEGYKRLLEGDWQVLEPAAPNPAGVLDVGPAGVWYSERVHADWVAAYRLLPDGGTPIVAEIRVFPYEPGHSFGRWSGQVCPRGGLPARVLRSVGVLTPLNSLTKNDRRRLLEAWPAAGAKLGIDPKLARRLRPTRTVTPAFLAATAKAYLDAHAEDPRSPYDGAVARLGYSKKYIKDLVRRARQEGYLTPTQRGKSGGALTAKALKELEGISNRRRTK